MKTRDQLRFNTLARYLIPASLLYLAFPYAIFFAGWLKWYYALPGIGLIALPLLHAFGEPGRIVRVEQARAHRPALKLPYIALVSLVALLLLGISGIGGYGYQDTDWLKHNAILKDLVTRPWPVFYRLGRDQVPLVYYVAYYLPAALLGKLGGWTLANQALFAWSLVGLILAMLWFSILSRRAAFTVVLLFVLFSGLDVVGQVIARSTVAPLRPEVGPLLRWDHIEQWSIGWQYSSNVTLLFWVPNQALAGWIGAGLLMHKIMHSPTTSYGSHRSRIAPWRSPHTGSGTGSGDPAGAKAGQLSLFYCGLTALWSPFVTIGLLPYLLAGLMLENSPLLRRLKRTVSMPNLCGLGLLIVVGLFYSAKLYEASPLLTTEMPSGFSLSFAPDTQARVIGLALIPVFCLLEFGLYAALIFATGRDWGNRTRELLATTLICLFLIPFYRYGGNNDFVMRVSIPGLFLLAILLARALHSLSLSGFQRIILTALVVLGAVTPLVEFLRHAKAIQSAGTILQTPAIAQVRGIGRWGLSEEKDRVIMLQYVGSSSAPFFRFLTKER